MQFTNYFFSSVISFSGLLAGILLIRIAPEEQKPLERYMVLLKRFLLSLIFVFAAFYYFNSWFYILILAAYFAFLLFAEYKIRDLYRKVMLAYAVFGILFFLSSKNPNLFAIESSLIMLYGLPTASLMYNKKEKNHYKLIFLNLGFIIIANALFFT